MYRVYEGRPCGLDRLLAAASGSSIGWRASIRAARCRGRPTRRGAVFDVSSASVPCTACSGCNTCCRSIRSGCRRSRPISSFNTAVSFATNTNWQGYGGETTMSYLSQMLGLTVQNFVSAAAGMAVLVALIRGLARRSAATIGNFWVDLARSTLYILLPLSIVLALVLVSQGVIQNFKPYETATVQPIDRRRGQGGHDADAARWARRRRRSRSSNSGPTAAGSSTSTRPIRSRTRRRSRTSWKCCRSS